ncbi:MAG: glycosyltransferase [Bacteroidetes bacterium]|nr:glycosyltransferase [Bacteroidota bacterium]
MLSLPEVSPELAKPIMFVAISVFACFFLLQVYYYLAYWLSVIRRAGRTPELLEAGTEPVSVVIYARNQSDQILRNLPVWMEQEYPEYEIVLVNDRSYDESQDVIISMQARYPSLRVVDVQEQDKHPTDRKFAIALGVKAASYARILFSHIDALPSSKHWIQYMQMAFDGGQEREIVLGYTGYTPYPGLISSLMQWDALRENLKLFGHAMRRRAYAGDGRNMGYLKGLFFFRKGFIAHVRHPSGEDDLFVNVASTPKNVGICLDAPAFVRINEEKSFQWFWKRKLKYVGNRSLFRPVDQTVLNYWAWNPWLVLFTALSGAWFSQQQPPFFWGVAAAFAVQLLLRWILLSVALRRFQIPMNILMLPILEFLYLFLSMAWTVRASAGRPVDS